MRVFLGKGCRWMSMRRLSKSLLVLVLCILLTSCSPSPGKVRDGVSPKATATRPAEPISLTGTAARPRTSPTAQGECQEKAGEVRSLTYPGSVFHKDVRLTVYLPPCYSNSNERYPSLYLLHGYPQDEQHWETLGVIDLVEEGILTGKWPPTLLVLPNQPEPARTRLQAWCDCSPPGPGVNACRTTRAP